MAQQLGPRPLTAHVQTPPVRLYCSAGRVMVAVPLPGLEPQDIIVKVVARRLAIHGRPRGQHEQRRNFVLDEWAAGPYYREVELPEPVNGGLANATYGNGVLVLVLPKLEPGQPSVDVELRLEVDRPPHGTRVGHTGRERQRTTTAEHLRKRAEVARRGRGFARAHAYW